MSKLSPRIKTIKSEIDRGDLTPTEVADRANIAFSTLYRILNGEQIPKIDTVEELERILKIKYERVAR